MNPHQPSPTTVARELGKQFEAARQLYARGNMAAAGELTHKLLLQVPGHQGALHLQVIINRDLGRLDAAEVLLRRLESLTGASNIDVLYEWGVLRHHQGRPLEAEAKLKALLAKRPNHANGHMVLGRIYDKMGRLGQADIALRHALEYRPNDFTICKDLASINERLGMVDTGIRFARLAYNLNPNYLDGILIWAKLEETRGDLDAAERLLDYAQQLAPDQPLVSLMRAYLQRRRGNFEQAYDLLAALEDKRLNPEALAITWQERGVCLERLGRFDEAFSAYSEMSAVNRTPPINRNYPEEEMRDEFERLQGFWNSLEVNALPHAPALPEGAPTPVFILGFPRSGTTMVEQIVTRHSAILAGDETHALDLTLGRWMGSASETPLLQFSQRLLQPDGQEQATRMQQEYLQQVRRQAILEPGYSYFTDKTPLNELHMGVIQAILPDSPMIHLIRHPLNVVLSSFFNDVRHGRGFATRLETTAQHYAHTMDLIEVYTERLDMRYLSVRYEDIVADLEGNARKIIDFIGLPWEERCLSFHESDRHVRTASALQVKEKLYTRSLERYKPFLKHLEPVIPILEPYIEKFGYSI